MSRPKSLLEAISNGMIYGPPNSRPSDHIYKCVVDFIEQRISILMVSSSPAELRAAIKLKELLFSEIDDNNNSSSGDL
jgi:hypothetical protein